MTFARRRRQTLLVFLATATLALGSAQARAAELVVALAEANGSMDPHWSTAPTNLNVDMQIFERLRQARDGLLRMIHGVLELSCERVELLLRLSAGVRVRRA